VSASRVSTDPDTAGGVGFTRARSLVVAHACGSAGKNRTESPSGWVPSTRNSSVINDSGMTRLGGPAASLPSTAPL